MVIKNRPRAVPSRSTSATVVTVVVLAAVAAVAIVLTDRPSTGDQLRAVELPAFGAYSYERLDDPPRTLVTSPSGQVLATLTDGARTVALAGPSRTFVEPTDPSIRVTTSTWVRLLPAPWQAGAETRDGFSSWLDVTLRERDPDVLGVAMQYTTGAGAVYDAAGVRTQGDADFGPVAARSNGREENSDFYDYLGVPWTFPDGTHEVPDQTHFGDADCSGFLRLVYGYRMGYPMLGTSTPGPGIPRRAFAIAEFGPGISSIPDRHQQATDYARLQPGDLVFFNIDPGVDEQVDHSGIYLGTDDHGRHRFISSRAKINGPTFGDAGGSSLLDDGGYYSTALRTARRL